jgi:hypothetical protein
LSDDRRLSRTAFDAGRPTGAVRWAFASAGDSFVATTGLTFESAVFTNKETAAVTGRESRASFPSMVDGQTFGKVESAFAGIIRFDTLLKH